jgi:NADPH:quinone reductase-like Zn-dependent oxidoreductase
LPITYFAPNQLEIAIQLLAASGFSPIITTASKHNEAYCKAAGATHVIDYHDVPYSDLPMALQKITSTPITVIYDTVSTPDSQKTCWEILPANGKLAVVLYPMVGQAGEVTEDGKQLVWVAGTANSPANFEFGRKMFAGLSRMLETGQIKVYCISIIA